MEKRAFFVVGPESTGTRVLTRLLIANGCYGDGGHEQRIDLEIGSHSSKFREYSMIVYRRSVPHDGDSPPIRWIISRLRAAGFRVLVLLTVRDFYCTTQSHILRTHAKDEESAFQRISSAYNWIFSELSQSGVSTIVVPFEAAVLHEPSRWKLLQYLGITTQNTTDNTVVRDENRKYFFEL